MPFFLVQVSLDRVPNLTQSLRHPQTGRMKRPTLIIVENAPNHGAILQDHVPGRFFLGKGGVVGVARLDHNRGLRQCLRFLFDPLTPLFQKWRPKVREVPPQTDEPCYNRRQP